jgi:hypothetical protein
MRSGLMCLEEPKDHYIKALNSEIVLGLKDHKDASVVLRRNEHAPPPWDVIDKDGTRVLDDNEIEEHQTYRYRLDKVGKTVLIESSHWNRVSNLMEDLLPYFLTPYKCEEIGDFSDAPLSAVVCPVLMSFYRSVQKKCAPDGDSSISDQDRKHITATLYENFYHSGNTLMPLVISKIHHHIQKEYGLKKHIFEHDSTRNVAVLTYSVTDRYHVAIFFCVNQIMIDEGNRRVANLLFRPEGSGEEKGKERVSKPKKKKESDICSFFSMGADDEGYYGISLRDKRRKNIISNGSIIERTSKNTRKEKERRILDLSTNGIIDVVIYSCFCNRKMVRL